MTRSVPFNLIDEWIVHLDQEPEPWSVHLEVRVSGRLEGERVASAALAASARHPMARARRASFRHRDRHYRWEIDDRVQHLPLEIVDCPDDAALAEARDRLQSMRVSIDSSPPFALTLAHHPGGDVLMLNLHHAAGDGIGAYRLLNSIARAYAGAEDPVPDLDPLAVRDLRARAGARSVRQALRRARLLRDRLVEARREGPPARVAGGGGAGDSRGYRFHLVPLGPEETARVLERRRRPATVNDLLLAALAIAIERFNAARGVPANLISVMMPVNLRPTDWAGEVVANILTFVSVSVPQRARSDLLSAQLAVADRTRALKERHLSGAAIDLMGLSRRWPVGISQFLARILREPLSGKAVDSAILSALGRLDPPPDFGPDAGAATELWFSPPAQMPLGSGIGAATMNDQLFLTLRYSPRHHDAAGAEELAQTWREVLLEG